MKQKNKKFLIFLVSVFLTINLGLLVYFLFFSPSQLDSTRAEVIFLDIGQGDAALIRTSKGKNILVDGGSDKSIIYKLDQYIPFYRRKIDLMILSHPHPDHFNGLIEVVERYRVDRFFYNGVHSNLPTYNYFLDLIEKKGIESKVVWAEHQFEIDNSQIVFLYPFESLEDKILADDNDGSLVFKFIIDQTKILFTGDATKKVEEELLAQEVHLSAEILKVAHHGSKDSSIQEFLDEVKPTYAVISAGRENKFGHPALRVLRNLENVNAEVLRTDQLADIIFEINRERLNLQNKR